MLTREMNGLGRESTSQNQWPTFSIPYVFQAPSKSAHNQVSTG